MHCSPKKLKGEKESNVIKTTEEKEKKSETKLSSKFGQRGSGQTRNQSRDLSSEICTSTRSLNPQGAQFISDLAKLHHSRRTPLEKRFKK
jgi:hypothetical protein